MKLRQLTYLVAIAAEKNFRRAAAVCHVSQPTLSAGLRELETELGAVLVLRNRHRFIDLTEEGRIAVRRAQQMIADSQSLKEEVQAGQNSVSGVLRIGVVPTCLPVIPAISAALRAKHPALRIKVLSLTSSEIQHRLENLEIDAGVIYDTPEFTRSFKKLASLVEGYMLVLPRTWIARDAEAIAWADAARLPLGLLTPDMQNRQLIDAVFRDIEAVPDIVVEADSLHVLLNHVDAGVCAAVMSEIYLRQGAGWRHIRAMRLIEPARTNTVAFIVSPREPVAPVVWAFQSVLEPVLSSRQLPELP